MSALYIIVRVFQFVISIALVIIVMIQTHKAEGLGTAVGGSSQGSSFRGRAGHEDLLNKYTAWLAIAFMIISVITFIIAQKIGV